MDYSQQDLERVAKHIVDALIEDALDFVIPVTVESFSDLHSWVDANEYGLNAVEELEITPDVQDPYKIMTDAEEVAFAVFRTTEKLDELRAICKDGAQVVEVYAVDETTCTLTVMGQVHRVAYLERDLLLTTEDETGSRQETEVSRLRLA